MSRDDDLFDEVGRLLGARGSWLLEASSTPGVPPAWCLDVEGELVLSVSVDGGAVTVYLPDIDREVAVGDLGGLTAWLDANEAGYRRA
jgi:hypothetical protein